MSAKRYFSLTEFFYLPTQWGLGAMIEVGSLGITAQVKVGPFEFGYMRVDNPAVKENVK